MLNILMVAPSRKDFLFLKIKKIKAHGEYEYSAAPVHTAFPEERL